MRLRRVHPDDFPALHHFPLGPPAGGPWLAEVAELVGGLQGWLRSIEAIDRDRHVLVLDDDGEIVGVAAHEAVVDEFGRVHPDHRYLMVTAVRDDRRRQGLARLLVESIVADLQRQGAASVTWLVHPGNAASRTFSRSVFPDADETSPPEDKPYIAFTLHLGKRTNAPR